MTHPAQERDRWTREWATQREDAIWGCPGMGWDAGIERDLRMIVPHLGLHVGHSAILLDLGCGPGRLAIPIAARSRWAHHYWRVHGVDICEPVIHAARVRKALSFLTNAFFHVGDGRRLPPAVLTVDAAYSMLLFQHLDGETVRGYLGEVARVLVPGGRFRFQFVVGPTDQPYSHDHDPEAMVGWLAAAGLQAEDAEPDPDWPTWVWATATKSG